MVICIHVVVSTSHEEMHQARLQALFICNLGGISDKSMLHIPRAVHEAIIWHAVWVGVGLEHASRWACVTGIARSRYHTIN